MHDILFLIPPFTQLNTPYPSTAYLKRYLNSKNIESYNIDIGIELFLKIFSSEGLTKIFSSVKESNNSNPVYHLKSYYINTIESVINFLQNKNLSIAWKISSRNYLPESARFDNLDDMQDIFSSSDIYDKARLISTLYIEDICDFISFEIDSLFSIGRYGENTGLFANKFKDFEKTLNHDTIILQFYKDILNKHLIQYPSKYICISIPFPGNLFFSFYSAKLIKKVFPERKIIFGGGFVNTELRNISNSDIFKYADYITLDDGEIPLENIITNKKPVRTFQLESGEIKFHDNSKNIPAKEGNWPDYSGLDLNRYLSFCEISNPMHRLWSEGHWNKLTLAHGCYWSGCSFCDTNLDYIKRYDPCNADLLISRITTLIKETGINNFHFTDEAAPPALLKNLAIGLLRNNIDISWWTNIRFEKSFSYDLCRLMSESGCIAVAGGLEVADERILKLINKGLTIEGAAKTLHNFSSSGIMVHSYLMYGFPTQTEKEIINSLEIIRQLFSFGCINSAYWHLFSMTAHSETGNNPSKFNCEIIGPKNYDFAYNDLIFKEKNSTDFKKFSNGLKKAIYNFMHGNLLEESIQHWFDFKTPPHLIKKDLIKKALKSKHKIDQKNNVYWIGGKIQLENDNAIIFDRTGRYEIHCNNDVSDFLKFVIQKYDIMNDENYTYDNFLNDAQEKLKDIEGFLNSETYFDFKELGLIFV